MITTLLNGGLGNQLFQMAAAYALALDNDGECAFRMDNPVVGQGNIASSYKNTVYERIKELSGKWRPNTVFKEGEVYKDIPYKDGMMLIGYFQDEIYFAKHKDFIIDLFSHKPTIERLKRAYSKILTNSISVHIRRGDYVKIGVTLDLNYYYTALNMVNVDNILVFSDDINWCKSNFLENAFYIHNSDYEDFYLMSLCTNNIIANSSFSGWAAYLNRNGGKTITPHSFTVSHSENDFYFKNKIWS